MAGFNEQLLDSELAKLKAIGADAISDKTNLSIEKIEDVLEKRFDKIDKVRAKGFMAILEREYGLDLRDWLLAKEHLQKEDSKSVSAVIAKQDEEERAQKMEENLAKIKNKELKILKEAAIEKKAKQKEHHIIELALKNEIKTKSHAESYSWLYVILVIVLLALMGYFAYKAFIQEHKEIVVESAQSAESSSDSNDEGAYEGLFFDSTKPLDSIKPESGTINLQSQDILPDSAPEPKVESKESKEAPQTNETTQTAQTQANQNTSSENFFLKPQTSEIESKPNALDSTKIESAQAMPKAEPNTTEAPKSSQDSSKIEATNAESSQSAQAIQTPQATQTSQPAPLLANDNTLHITAQNDLWLGIINLTSGTKEQFAYRNKYDIKMEGQMLFVMGHNSFSATLNGKTITHSSRPPVRMYYDGKNLVEIGYTRFKQLNGGLEW